MITLSEAMKEDIWQDAYEEASMSMSPACMDFPAYHQEIYDAMVADIIKDLEASLD